MTIINITTVPSSYEEWKLQFGHALMVAKKVAFTQDDPALLMTCTFAERALLTVSFTSDEAPAPAYADIGTAAIVDGWKLVVNTNFFSQLTPPEWLFILFHETLHIRYYHMERFKDCDLELSNVACDLAINSGAMMTHWMSYTLKGTSAMWPFTCLIKRPADGCFIGDGEFADPNVWQANMSAEHYYDILIEDVKEKIKNAIQQGQGQQGQGQPIPLSKELQKQLGDLIDKLPKQQQRGQRQQGQPGQGQPGQGQPGQNQGQGQGQGQPSEVSKELAEAMAKAVQDLADKIGNGTGKFSKPDSNAKTEDAKDRVEEIAKKSMEQAREDAQKVRSAPGVKLTPEKLEDFIEAMRRAGGEESFGCSESTEMEIEVPESKASAMGVDGIVLDVTADAMWEEILAPLKDYILSEETRYHHDEVGMYAISDAVSDAIGEEIMLKGRVESQVCGGELLIVLDTSGSMGDDWVRGIAKAASILFGDTTTKNVVIRLVLFSDHISDEEEFIIFNSEDRDPEDFDKSSILFDGHEVPEDQIVDAADLIGDVDLRDIIRTKIGWGGGTAMKPVIDAIRRTTGLDDLSERFKVTVVITDGDLYCEPQWVRSAAMTEIFGENLTWIFFEHHGVDYRSIVGGRKLMLPANSNW